MRQLIFKLLIILAVVSFAAVSVAETFRQGDVRSIFNPGEFAIKTAAYTALSTDEQISVTASSADIVITLPSISSLRGNTKTYKVLKLDSTAYSIVVTPASGDTIGGESTRYLTYQNSYMIITTSSGNITNWQVVFESPYTVEDYEAGTVAMRGTATKFANGTASLPSITFNSDTNTGFYRASANVVQFTANGSASFKFAGDSISALTTNAAAMLDSATSATIPTLLPDNQDVNTGIGATAGNTDVLSLIAGGVEGIRITESGAITTTMAGTTNMTTATAATVTTTGDITVTADSTGGNAGARSQIIGLPKTRLYAFGAVLNDVAGETVEYIDDTEAGGEWVEIDSGTIVTLTDDSSIYRVGSKSLKIAFTAGASENVDGVDGTITNDDLEANESIGFWIYSDTTLASGDLDLTLDDDTASPDVAIVIPAITADIWTWVELDIAGAVCSGGDCDVVSGIKILLTAQGETALTGGAFAIYLDGMYKWDVDDEETLGASIVQDGVISVVAYTEGTPNTTTLLVENTNYFTHYQTGADAIVGIGNNSAVTAIALVAYE